MSRTDGPFVVPALVGVLATILLVAGLGYGFFGFVHALTREDSQPGWFFSCCVPLIFTLSDFYRSLVNRAPSRTFWVSVIVTAVALVVITNFGGGEFALGLVFLMLSIGAYKLQDHLG